jgi:hypothetical protein
VGTCGEYIHCGTSDPVEDPEPTDDEESSPDCDPLTAEDVFLRLETACPVGDDGKYGEECKSVQCALNVEELTEDVLSCRAAAGPESFAELEELRSTLQRVCALRPPTKSTSPSGEEGEDGEGPELCDILVPAELFLPLEQACSTEGESTCRKDACEMFLAELDEPTVGCYATEFNMDSAALLDFCTNSTCDIVAARAVLEDARDACPYEPGSDAYGRICRQEPCLESLELVSESVLACASAG